LGITNAFALLRLLPGSDRDKDIEILSLRHQLAVLQRSSTASRSGSMRLSEHGWPRCYNRCHDRHCGACGCWSGQTRSSSGTVT
jgi:hypothetical protein